VKTHSGGFSTGNSQSVDCRCLGHQLKRVSILELGSTQGHFLQRIGDGLSVIGSLTTQSFLLVAESRLLSPLRAHAFRSPPRAPTHNPILKRPLTQLLGHPSVAPNSNAQIIRPLHVRVDPTSKSRSVYRIQHAQPRRHSGQDYATAATPT